MSKFLGQIHYWLYNKILLFEKIEDRIIEWAKDKRLPIELFNPEYEYIRKENGTHTIRIR